jgi:hypothetical protein
MLFKSPKEWNENRQLFGNQADLISNNGSYVTNMQTTLTFGAPISHNGTRYKDANDRWLEQKDIIVDFINDVEELLKESGIFF